MTSNSSSSGSSSPLRPGLVAGLLAPFRGAGMFRRHPRLSVLAAIPVAINTILFALFFYLTVKYFGRWLQALLPQSQAWYWLALTYLLYVILVIVLLLAVVLTFTIMANVLSSPFNDALSARTETLVTGQGEVSFTLAGLAREMGRTVIEELKKILFYVLVIGLIFTLNLVPVVGSVIYTILATIFTIFWLGLTFLDYAFARHGLKLGDKIRFIRRNYRPVFGFGLSVFGGAVVPVLNLAFFPMAVVGGTLLFLDLQGGLSKDIRKAD